VGEISVRDTIGREERRSAVCTLQIGERRDLRIAGERMKILVGDGQLR
jgi:hypothetical protein